VLLAVSLGVSLGGDKPLLGFCSLFWELYCSYLRIITLQGGIHTHSLLLVQVLVHMHLLYFTVAGVLV
jgi:hypothetical protein